MSTMRPRSFANSRRVFGAPGVRTGIHVLKKLPGLEYCRPSWNNKETIIRILPGLDPDNRTSKTFDAFRVSDELGRYGTWQCCYEAVRKFGDPGVTFLLHDNSNPRYNAYQMNPCWILYRSIKEACERGQGKAEWFPLLQGKDKSGASLNKPTELLLVQAAIFRHDSKDQFEGSRLPFGLNKLDPTVVFEFSKSSADRLFEVIDERIEGWVGDDDDPTQFKWGDPVAIADGAFVHIYEFGTDLTAARGLTKKAASLAAMYQSKPTSQGHGGFGGRKQIGYDCHLTKTLDGGPDDVPAHFIGLEDIIRGKVRHWDDILEFMTDEEQAHLINPLFPASAIMYAFRDHKEWILDETRRAAVGAKTVDMHQGSPVSKDVEDMASAATWSRPRTIADMAPPTVETSAEYTNNPFADDETIDSSVPGGSIPESASVLPDMNQTLAKADSMGRQRITRMEVTD